MEENNKFYILECEDIKERSLFNSHKKIIESIENPKVLVLLWTTNNLEKKKNYEKIIRVYFLDLGVKEIYFLEEEDKEFIKKFKDSNILYLPGGDTALFLKTLLENPLVLENLKNFKGHVIGNSAGAIVLSEKGYSYKEGEVVEHKGIGILNIKVFVHFKLEYLKFLKESDILTIGDNGIIVFVKK